MRSRRTPLAATAVLAVLALGAAGCGQQPEADGKTGSDKAGSKTGSKTGSDKAGGAKTSSNVGGSLATQPWVVRFDSYGGADGESITTRYVRVVPVGGRAQVATMPEVQAAEARSKALLVDAGHQWALADTRPSAAERKAGRVSVHDLTAKGRTRTLDVRQASGDASLQTDWVSFDPEQPGLLRVVSGKDVWKVQVPSATTTREGPLPSRADWIYSGGFVDRTGQPFIEDLTTFDTLPAGNGGDVSHPIKRDGGTVLDPDQEKPYGDRPAPGCESSAGFAAADGTDWAFCQAGSKVAVKRLAKGAGKWTTVATTGAVVSADAVPVLALPPSGS